MKNIVFLTLLSLGSQISAQKDLIRELYQTRFTNPSDSAVLFQSDGNFAQATYYSREFQEEYTYVFRLYIRAGDTLVIQIATDYPCESESCGIYADLWQYNYGKLSSGDYSDERFAPFSNEALEKVIIQRGYFKSISHEYSFWGNFNLAFLDSNTILVRYIDKHADVIDDKLTATELTYETYLRFKRGEWIIDSPKQEQLSVVDWEQLKEDYDLTGSINDPDGYSNIRKKRSASSKKVDVVYFNESFYYKYPVDGWCEVILRTGSKGYVHSGRIEHY